MADRGSNLPSTYFDKIKDTFQKFGKELIRLVTNTKSLDGETEETSILNRVTFGEKNEKAFKTILLVGETGTGKSSLINAMVNYVLGVRFLDKKRFWIIKEKGTSQSESQTSAVTVYDIFTDKDSEFLYNLTIIDTPGYGDTRGLDHDEAVARILLELFRSNDGIHELNAVGFVVKATENRLSDRQRYIFDAVIALFGKDMKKNIVALLTHSDGGPAKNAIQALKDAKIQCAEDEDGDPVHFFFNNRVPEVPKEKKNEVKEERRLSNAWETSNDGMKELFEFLDKTPPRQLAMTVDVLNRRVQIEALVTSYQEQIKYIEMKQTERRQVEEALKKQKETCSVTVDEPYKEKVPIDAWWDTKATCCTVCEENCHYPGCILAIDPSWCLVMENEHCTSCRGRCHHDKHVKENKMYVMKTRQITKKYEDLLKEYMKEEDRSEMTRMEELLAAVQTSIEKATAKKSQLVEDSYQNVLKLQEIALKSGSLSTFLQLDFLIQKLKETGEPDSDQKVQKLMEIKKQIREENRAGVDYLVRK